MKLRVHTIGVQVFLWFLLCSLLLLAGFSGLYYKRTSDQINTRVGEIAMKNMSQAREHVELLVKGYDSLTKSIVGNPDIQRLLSLEEVNPAVQKINERTIVNVLSTFYYSRDDGVGIHILVNNGMIYSYGNNFTQVVYAPYRDSGWYAKLTGSKGEMVWLGVQPRSVLDQTQKTPVFSFGRQLIDWHTGKSLGVVLVEMQPMSIFKTLDNLKLGEHTEAYILDENGHVVARPEKEINKPLSFQLPAMNQDDETVRLQKDAKAIYVVGLEERSEWQIVSATPRSDLAVELNETKHFLLLAVGLLLGFSVVLAIIVSQSVSSPLRKLVRDMKQVERGNFNITLQVRSIGEIQFMVSAFNRMVSRINDLVERVKAVSTSEKNAQLQALQSQVNPHFLYNTLDMIYWMLDEKEEESLGKLILSLSGMFRYSSQWDNYAEVTLGEEAEQIRNYLCIIQARLGGRLVVEFDLPEEWLSVRLPKMTLQPLIENAIVHGLAPQNQSGRLSLSMVEEEEALLIRISDSGIGIDDATKESIRESLKRITEAEAEAGKESSSKGTGIGLENVHRRLVLQFGAEFGLELTGGEMGTIVTVRLPIPAELRRSEHEHTRCG